MTDALYRVALPGGPCLARGTIEEGPQELLPSAITLDGLLANGATGLASALTMGSAGPCPSGAPWLAPVEQQEVWCTGVTYERTREARAKTTAAASFTDQLYTAERPELFFKAPGWRVRGPLQAIAIRADPGWDMAEPELGLVIGADGRIAGYVIANDVTSRAIEQANPLYLPQAKVYDGSCALGPAIVPCGAAEPPFPVAMAIRRGDTLLYEGRTSTARMVRPLDDLAAWLFRALAFPVGVVLLTGCGLVPDTALTLQAGDRVRIEMGVLGALEHEVHVLP